MTKHLNQLINSGITLNEQETAIVERFIERHSQPVKPEHLNHYKCLSVIR